MPEFDIADLGNLRNITGKKDHEELDQAVVDAYWAYKRVWDRAMSSSIPVEQLVTIVILAGKAGPIDNDIKVKHIPQLVQEGAFHVGQRVETVWRRKAVMGSFVRIGKEDSVVVLIDGDSTEREIAATLVKPIGVVAKLELVEEFA